MYERQRPVQLQSRHRSLSDLGGGSFPESCPRSPTRRIDANPGDAYLRVQRAAVLVTVLSMLASLESLEAAAGSSAELSHARKLAHL